MAATREHEPRRSISSGSRFEQEVGYARAVVVGDTIYISGTTGFDYQTMTIAPDVAAQCEQALRNIDQALREAGASFTDVVRVRYFLRDADEFRLCFPLLRAAFGEAQPAATMLVVAGFADPAIRIEIEVTARR
jgi:enamine deaminase RidA (YjgF/YER057c/UK114 family)